jgi:uncharacterized membrane protein (DUF2068 family)
MVQQNPDTVKSIIEIGTWAMAVFSTSIIVIVYVLHTRLIKNRFGV